MNRKNPLLKIAGVFLAVGLALYYIGTQGVLADKNEAKTASSVVYEEKEYAAGLSGLEQIVIQARNMPVTVQAVKGSEISLRYFTSEDDPYDVTLNSGTLKLQYRNRNLFDSGNFFSWGSRIITGQPDLRVELMIPETYAGMLELDTSNATLTVSGMTMLGTVRLDTSNASVNLNHITAKQVDAHTSNGKVTLEKVLSSGSINAETSNGGVTAVQTAAQEKIYLKTSNGHVSVDKITSKEIELRSSNGSITGGVGGSRDDYLVSSDTSNADNNLGSGGNGPNRLTVNTSNGAISIRFLGD